MSSFRGLYTSLYDSLPVDAIRYIERAIWYKMSGQGDDARAIFDRELKAYRSFSVVVIERADLELETGRWGAAWRILDSAQFLSGIPDAKISYYDEAAQCQRDFITGRKSIEELSKWFGTKPMLNSTASKTSLVGMMAQSRLLHLHTHCNWDFADPLDHHIELPDMEEAAGQNKDQITKLTTREIFDMRVLPGTHINVIACQGGVVEVKPGDEVMGLIPALLYSGASSTVSTLWSIEDKDGAKFAFHFFESFLRQCVSQGANQLQDGEVGGVDEHSSTTKRSRGTSISIAKAVQNAIREMDKGQIMPSYHWAAFVTHGFWQYPLSKEDIARLREH
jgi:hypothetical protein